MSDVESRWPEELAPVELAVEDIPVLPRHLGRTAGAAGLAGAGHPDRRRRGWCCSGARSSTAPRRRADLEALLLTVVVEQLADYLGVPAEDVHPDYEP